MKVTVSPALILVVELESVFTPGSRISVVATIFCTLRPLRESRGPSLGGLVIPSPGPGGYLGTGVDCNGLTLATGLLGICI